MMRNPNIDGLRLIAAIGVISLHTGNYAELPVLGGDIITSIFRWAVPAFFIITGYYLADEQGRLRELTLGQFSKPLFLFAMYTLFYLPFLVARFGLGAINLEILTRGTDIHLWYLSALPIALISLNALRGQKALLLATAGVILCLYIGASYVWTVTHKIYGIVMVLREFVGIPCILAGALMRSWGQSNSSFHWLLLLAGCSLLALEVAGIHIAGKRAMDLQFGLNTLLIAMGIVGLMLNSRPIFPAFFSRIGFDESAGIYVFHRAIMVIAASMLAMRPTLTFDSIPSSSLWILTGILTVGLLLALRWVSPMSRAFIDGRFGSRQETMGG